MKEKLKKLIPTKRKLIQLYSALLFNANIKGFFNGKIYKGNTKSVCAPGINCYSCPGAVGACPLGTLQGALASSHKRTPFYVMGILLLYGLLLGRFICGFLCPFGLIQELLYKIKTPKLKKNLATKILSYLKYVILAFFVIIVPLLYAFKDFPLPAFCKYICPAGTLEGAIGLLSNKLNADKLGTLGPLFTWKFFLLISIVLGSIFIFRMFCRFICPLGALYSLFNHFSVFGIKLEKEKCTDCGLCVSKCKMDIRHVNDHECISCGECIDVCPTNAISWKGSKIILPPDEITSIPDNATDEEIEIINRENEALAQRNEKIKKRNRILKYVVCGVMIGILAFAIIYFNFIQRDKNGTEVVLPPPVNQVVPEGAPPLGNQVGNTCIGYNLPVFNASGLTGETFNPAMNTGKITIINFWGTWCSPCCAELPYFNQIASDYADSVTVVAVHTDMDFSTAPDYISKNFAGSNIIFAKDEYVDGSVYEAYNIYLGVGDFYPTTLILDENGVIIQRLSGKAVTYEMLKEFIDAELAK